jgi:hypothetical protein
MGSVCNALFLEKLVVSCELVAASHELMSESKSIVDEKTFGFDILLFDVST